jgi:hypothetical protein
MRFKLFLGGILAMAVVVLLVSLDRRIDASTGPIPLNCNRACLENVVDQYLAAVIAHNPKMAPLSADVKYTENDQRLEVGDGLWKTAQGRGKYTHIFSDPEFGQVAYMGTVMEGGGAIPVELALANRTWPHHGNRKRSVQAGRRRAEQYRKYGQALRARRFLVQVHYSGTTDVTTGVDRRRGRLFHRLAEKRR